LKTDKAPNNLRILETSSDKEPKWREPADCEDIVNHPKERNRIMIFTRTARNFLNN